jgi:acyl-CoA thioesterase FadM
MVKRTVSNNPFPLTYAEFSKSFIPIQRPNGFDIVVRRDWIIPTEDRLSYASITRIVEWCREYHWIKDVAFLGEMLDSTVVSMVARFNKIIFTGSNLRIEYVIGGVRSRSYTITVSIFLLSSIGMKLSSEFDLQCVFVNPITKSPMCIPKAIYRVLLDRSSKKEQK